MISIVLLLSDVALHPTTDGEDGAGHKLKTKRVRTSFTEEQLRILHANFRVDSNPDGQDLERIAQQTGLSKRVTQVQPLCMKTLTTNLNVCMCVVRDKV